MMHNAGLLVLITIYISYKSMYRCIYNLHIIQVHVQVYIKQSYNIIQIGYYSTYNEIKHDSIDYRVNTVCNCEKTNNKN